MPAVKSKQVIKETTSEQKKASASKKRVSFASEVEVQEFTVPTKKAKLQSDDKKLSKQQQPKKSVKAKKDTKEEKNVAKPAKAKKAVKEGQATKPAKAKKVIKTEKTAQPAMAKKGKKQVEEEEEEQMDQDSSENELAKDGEEEYMEQDNSASEPEEEVEQDGSENEPEKEEQEDSHNSDDEEVDEDDALKKEILGDLVSDDEDSSDEEDQIKADTFSENKDVVAISNRKMQQSMLETKAKFDKHRKKSTDGDVEPGVIYIGRIPHGFYEKEMKQYFSQFGDVTRLRLSRNKKTGRSKHYAFIEFASHEVAQIVAETMHNYLLFGRLLQCHYIPKDRVPPKLFYPSLITIKREKNPVPRKHIAKQNRQRTEEEYEKLYKRLLYRHKVRREKIKEAGIVYDFPGYDALIAARQSAKEKAQKQKK